MLIQGLLNNCPKGKLREVELKQCSVANFQNLYIGSKLVINSYGVRTDLFRPSINLFKNTTDLFKRTQCKLIIIQQKLFSIFMTMLKTITLKPIEAQLNYDTSICGELNPYCLVFDGKNKIQGEVCKRGGKSPVWSDSIHIKKTNQTMIYIEIKDWNRYKAHKLLGIVPIDLSEFEFNENLTKWFDVISNREAVGQILIEISIIVHAAIQDIHTEKKMTENDAKNPDIKTKTFDKTQTTNETREKFPNNSKSESSINDTPIFQIQNVYNDFTTTSCKLN